MHMIADKDDSMMSHSSEIPMLISKGVCTTSNEIITISVKILVLILIYMVTNYLVMNMELTNHQSIQTRLNSKGIGIGINQIQIIDRTQIQIIDRTTRPSRRIAFVRIIKTQIMMLIMILLVFTVQNF